jgi:thiamine biosynthesis lipoprotein ApbE
MIGPMSQRSIVQAIMERERGRLRLRRVTAAIGMASVAAAGALAAVLPGSSMPARRRRVVPPPAVPRPPVCVRWCGRQRRDGGYIGRFQFAEPARLLGTARVQFRQQSRDVRWFVMGVGWQQRDEGIAAADWEALGTLVRLVVTDSHRLARVRELVECEVAEIDACCSRFRMDSEIVALNASAGTGWVAVSALLFEAVAVALHAARLTGGAVDPTVGTALAAVGYDRDFTLVRRAGGPGPAVQVQAVPGWRQVRLDTARRRIQFPAGILLDLGATAKAWTADRVAAGGCAVAGCGVLVSLGGDIAIAGPPPRGGWRIRVQDRTGLPAHAPDGPSAVVSIQSGGLATSSTAARRWRHGSMELHHIIDPQTGLPAVPV